MAVEVKANQDTRKIKGPNAERPHNEDSCQGKKVLGIINKNTEKEQVERASLPALTVGWGHLSLWKLSTRKRYQLVGAWNGQQ